MARSQANSWDPILLISQECVRFVYTQTISDSETDSFIVDRVNANPSLSDIVNPYPTITSPIRGTQLFEL